jgi:hypothetical protein
LEIFDREGWRGGYAFRQRKALQEIRKALNSKKRGITQKLQITSKKVKKY